MTIEEHHFGLTGRPFQLTPDPDFWFESATHRKAMAYLGYGLVLGEGFIIITGEIGSGKTTLLGHLGATLDPTRVEVLQLNLAVMAQDDVLGLVARKLGCEGEAQSSADLVAGIEAQVALRARMGKRLLIVIDEAQGLGMPALEHLRMVSNFNSGTDPVVQFLLLGQPEFRETLADPNLEQLSQRVIASHHLTAMEPAEIKSYVEHRLRHVGWTGSPEITAEAAVRLCALTGGIPRRINQLMGRALLLAAMTDAAQVNARMIDTVHEEEQQEHSPKPPVSATMPDLELAGAVDVSILDPAAPPVVVDAEAPTPVPGLSGMLDRLTELEVQVSEQDMALRRVLNLLIDWVEGQNAQRPVTGTAA